MASPDRHFAAGALFTETAAPGTPNANDVWLYPKSDKKFYGKDDTGAEFPIGSGSKTLARFTPDNNQPPAANFATLDTRNSIAVLDFDDSTDESAIFVSICPEGADLASASRFASSGPPTTATSGDVVWEIAGKTEHRHRLGQLRHRSQRDHDNERNQRSAELLQRSPSPPSTRLLWETASASR
jgi:hypothetical protein